MKEFEAILRVKDEKAEELQTLVKELEKKNLELQVMYMHSLENMFLL
jgi:hypothetical protein